MKTFLVWVQTNRIVMFACTRDDPAQGYIPKLTRFRLASLEFSQSSASFWEAEGGVN
jgi:hypothetical protein